jgi:ribosome-interacting GTPase 1
MGIRLNEEAPNITLKKRDAGGINFQTMVPQTKGVEVLLATRILREYVEEDAAAAAATSTTTPACCCC